MDNNEIKKYIVKITYNNYGGSGVIIPLSATKEYFYIFTVKHTFFNEDIKIENIDISNIEDKIIIENPDIGKINVTNKDIQPDIDKKYDLLIFRILVKLNPKIENLKPLSIFSDDFRECTVMGYPKARINKETKYDTFTCFYKQQNKKPYIFEMDSNKLLTTHRDKYLNPKDSISGISGSGVFVKDSTEELYLVGIQIQSATHNALIAIDLREIFDEINKKLNNTLTIGGYQFFEEIGLDIKKLEFSNLLDKLNNEEISKIKKHNGFDSEINFLEQNNYRKSMNKKYNELQKKMKLLSDTFLYQGIIFHENGKHQQATNRFKKAITLYPEYKHYFAKAKYERDTITKKQKEAKQKIDKESNFINDINLVIDTLKSDIKSYEENEKYEELEEVYRQLISLLSIEFDKNEDEIKNLSKKLSKILISNKKFVEAEDILLKIEDSDIGFDLYKIYSNQEFIKNSCLNKKQFSNKLLNLLGLLDRKSSEYKDIKNRLEELNIFDNHMIEFHEKFISLENKYETTIKKLTDDIQLLSNNISDKTLLKKINYRVFNTDKKLDIIIGVIKKTNNKKIDNILENICNSNKVLVNKIQTMYHQNDRVSKKAKIALNESILSMNKKIDEFSNNNIQNIEKIIKDSNWNFYNAIQGLLEKETDLYNRKLLEMYIAFTKQEHKLHIENLEKFHDVKVRKLLEEKNNLAKLMDELAVDYQNSENKYIKTKKEFILLEKKYIALKKQIMSIKKILSKEDELKYINEINKLKQSIEKLKVQNEQINKLKENIKLSSDTANKLVDLEKNCIKIDDIEKRFNQIKYNPKNEKRLRRISKQIHGFENKLEEIKKAKSKDPKITLKLVRADLEKIESIMNENKRPIWNIYFKTRFVILTLIFLIPITVCIIEDFSECIILFNNIFSK